MAGDVSLTIDDRELVAFIRGFSRRSTAMPALLRQARAAYADELLEDIRTHTPYRPHEGGEEEAHARESWALEQHGEDLAIASHVAHMEYLLHGNHANGPDGLIHPTEAAVLHFYDGGSEVFARGVRPMHADPELVDAFDRAQHAAEHFAHEVAERALAALRGAL